MEKIVGGISTELLLKSVGFFVGNDTPIGPAYLGYGYAADDNNAFTSF